MPARPETEVQHPDGVRARMQAQRERDTVPEMALRRILHRLGLRYRLGLNVIPGTRRTTDITFRPAMVAVFVDGCFWHGCTKHRGQPPATNRQFWLDKIHSNVVRDRDTDRRLQQAGWTVVRVWEHDDMNLAARRIEALVRRR